VGCAELRSFAAKNPQAVENDREKFSKGLTTLSNNDSLLRGKPLPRPIVNRRQTTRDRSAFEKNDGTGGLVGFETLRNGIQLAV
jgi:hypothetical protein